MQSGVKHMLLVCQKSSSSSHATANRSLKNPEMFPKGLQTKALPRPACKPFQIHGNKFKAIPHNSKCRYGERGTADAKPKAQIILDAAKVSAASGGNSEPKQGQRSQSARGFCPPKHDAGTATRHYRAFWQRRCRAAAAGAVLKPSGGNCAVLP